MDYNSGKWGATPNVYTITSIEPGLDDGDLIVAFVYGGGEEYTCAVVANNSTGSNSSSVGQIGYPDGVVYRGL